MAKSSSVQQMPFPVSVPFTLGRNGTILGAQLHHLQF